MTHSVSRRRWRRPLLLLAIVVVVLLVVTRGWWLPRWARWLDVSQPPRQADYALILGGGADSRPFLASALQRKGYVHHVLVVAPKPGPDVQDGIVPNEDELTRRLLRLRGVPDQAIIKLPGEVNSTFDEAHALNRFLDEHPDATVAIVTTCFHTRRARMVFRHVLGPQRAQQLYFVGVPTDRFDASNWWTSEDGVVTYLNETAKSVYYAIRY